MHKPYFSIVIPTKNRPDYLRESVLSALLQNFEDFEVIVSDNFNDERTKNVIEQFKDNPKLKYFRTEQEMNMLDHWEFATLKAIGKYVILLPDRKVLYQNSLKKLYTILRKHQEKINVCSYGVKMFDDENKKMGWNFETLKTQFFKSKKLIDVFVNENYYSDKSMDSYLPKTLNGGYKNEFAEKVRKLNGHYFNTPGVTTPDYSSCFINLALNDEILFVGETIILSQGEKNSNGRNFGKGYFHSYMNALKIQDPYKLVPIKAPFIYNLLISDLLIIKSAFEHNLKNITPNWANFFVANYDEFLMKKNAKLISEKELSYFFEEWKNGLQLFDKNIQASVNSSIHNTEKNTSKKLNYFKNLRLHTKDFINHRFSQNTLINKLMKHRFKNAISAAGFNS